MERGGQHHSSDVRWKTVPQTSGSAAAAGNTLSVADGGQTVRLRRTYIQWRWRDRTYSRRL